MKKIIIIVIGVGVVLVAGLILFSYFTLPNHVRSETTDAVTSETLDKRVKDAIDEGKEYIYDKPGINLPFGMDLLQVLSRHFETDFIDQGAGLYQGKINTCVFVELLLNSNGNVGQIQLRMTKDATDQDCMQTLAQYARFMNQEISDDTARETAKKAYDLLSKLERGTSDLIFFDDVGFAVRKAEDGQEYAYIP